VSVYRLEVSYDGSGFHGYARQTGQRTIQGVLDDALAVLLKTAVATAVAGRTDAGVHARGQVISFEHDGEVDTERLMRGLNGLVGPEVSVRAVSLAPADFNARFSARWRRYRYELDMATSQDPLDRVHVWHIGRGLDVDSMRSAAAVFVGEHDFSSFCRSVEGKSNVRRVTMLTVEGDGTRLTIWIQANAFCHQMVRSIVGYLYDVGRGFITSESVAPTLTSKSRSAVATVAPPHGLTLWEVGY
jgi:tRNA pseudouridine38-40 synthase